MLHKAIKIAAALVAIALAGCGTAPTKPLPPQVAAVAPTAFRVIADGAVGVAVSKGVKPADIAAGAYQLEQFASGQNVTMQALTTEIMKLEQQAALNPAQMLAVGEMRAAFDTIILGYINNGVIAGTAKTTLQEILNDIIAAAVLLGAPPPVPVPASADNDVVLTTTTTADSGPPAPARAKSPSMAALESPPVVGAALSTVTVAALKAFAHVEVSSPVAAGISVIGAFLAGWLEQH